MTIEERVKNYLNIEKGPLRAFSKLVISGKNVYCCQNGIGVYYNEGQVPECFNEFKVIEKSEEYTVVQIKNIQDYMDLYK